MERVESLKHELEAINLWDRLYSQDPDPSRIDEDACAARFFRRSQIAVELARLTRDALFGVETDYES